MTTTNPWSRHVSKYWKAHPHQDFKRVLQNASKTYRIIKRVTFNKNLECWYYYDEKDALSPQRRVRRMVKPPEAGLRRVPSILKSHDFSRDWAGAVRRTGPPPPPHHQPSYPARLGQEAERLRRELGEMQAAVQTKGEQWSVLDKLSRQLAAELGELKAELGKNEAISSASEAISKELKTALGMLSE